MAKAKIIRKGSRVLIDAHEPAESWTGYVTGDDGDVYFVSETPHGHDPICIEKTRVTLA